LPMSVFFHLQAERLFLLIDSNVTRLSELRNTKLLRERLDDVIQRSLPVTLLLSDFT